MSSKNIRVYELAKQLNKTSKEVMAVLAEKNIEVTTHMATLEENQVSMVRAKLGEPKPAKEEKQAPKQEATSAQAQTQEAKPAPKKKKFIVVHNPENSRDKKSPERRTAAKKPRGERPQSRREAAAKPEAKAKPAAKPEGKAKPEVKPLAVQADLKPAAKPETKIEAKSETKPENRKAEVRTENRPPARSLEGSRSNADRPQGNRQDGRNNGNRQDGRAGTNRQGYNRTDRPQGNRQDTRTGADRSGYNRADRPQGSRQDGRTDRPGYNRNNNGTDRPNYNRTDRPQGNRQDGRTGGYNSRGRTDRPQGGRPDNRGGQGGRNTLGRQMNKAFETPVESKPENRRYDNRNHQKQEKQYKDADISKLKNKPGRFIRPETRPAAVRKEDLEPKKLPLPESISIADLAERMKIQPSAIIKKLFLEGKMLTVNSELDFDSAGEIAME